MPDWAVACRWVADRDVPDSESTDSCRPVVSSATPVLVAARSRSYLIMVVEICRLTAIGHLRGVPRRDIGAATSAPMTCVASSGLGEWDHADAGYFYTHEALLELWDGWVKIFCLVVALDVKDAPRSGQVVAWNDGWLAPNPLGHF